MVLAACGADRKRPLTECERSSINRAARDWRLPISPATISRILPRFGPRTSHYRRSQGTEQPRAGLEILIQLRGLIAAGLLALRRHLTLSSCTNCCAAWEMLPVRFCSQCFRIHTSIAAGFVLICTPSGDVAFAALI